MKTAFAGLALTFLTALTTANAGTTVDFSHGLQGWDNQPVYDGEAGAWIDSSYGSPALHTINPETFGMTWSNTTNPAFVGNYGASPSVTLGIDILANSIIYWGTGMEVTRNLVVELRDYDNPYQGMPYTSVWYNLGTIGAGMGWQHFEVTIGDTASTALPGGWGGYGIDDTETGGVPALPPDRSFADVLASVDEIAFTTYVPGYFYGWTGYDVVVDNLSIGAAAAEVPEPGSLAMLAGGLGMLGLARRRRTTGAHSRT